MSEAQTENPVFIRKGSDAWEAWREFLGRRTPPTAQREIAGEMVEGWYFPTLFPVAKPDDGSWLEDWRALERSDPAPSGVENGDKGLPPQHKFVCDTEGLTAWAATFDRIVVRDVLGGRKLIKIARRDEEVFSVTISREQAAHLAGLLTSSGKMDE